MCAHGTSVAGACSSTVRLLQSSSQAGKCLSSSSCGTFAVLSSREWHSRDDGEYSQAAHLEAHTGRRCDSATDYGRRIPERMQEQVVDAPVPMTVH